MIHCTTVPGTVGNRSWTEPSWDMIRWGVKFYRELERKNERVATEVLT